MKISPNNNTSQNSFLQEGVDTEQPNDAVMVTSTRKVQFQTIEIRYFEYTLGDNPAVGDGVPVTINWKPHATETIDISFFEQRRHEVRRTGSGLKIPVRERANMVLNSGVSVEELTAAIEAVLQAQKLRRQSNRQQKWDKYFEFKEAAIQIFHRLNSIDPTELETHRKIYISKLPIGVSESQPAPTELRAKLQKARID